MSSVIHLQHPANEGADDYRRVARKATLCWNTKPRCVKTENVQEVTCKQCLAVMRGRRSNYQVANSRQGV